MLQSNTQYQWLTQFADKIMPAALRWLQFEKGKGVFQQIMKQPMTADKTVLVLALSMSQQKFVFRVYSVKQKFWQADYFTDEMILGLVILTSDITQRDIRDQLTGLLQERYTRICKMINSNKLTPTLAVAQEDLVNLVPIKMFLTNTSFNQLPRSGLYQIYYFAHNYNNNHLQEKQIDKWGLVLPVFINLPRDKNLHTGPAFELLCTVNLTDIHYANKMRQLVLCLSNILSMASLLRESGVYFKNESQYASRMGTQLCYLAALNRQCDEMVVDVITL